MLGIDTYTRVLEGNKTTEPALHRECFFYYSAWCGDGIITPNKEQCDPGLNLNDWSDDVMPNGAKPTATYNCTATCTITEDKKPEPKDPNLTIDKQQRLANTADTFSGVGLNTPSNIHYLTPANFEFKIIITNAGGDANNVQLHDTLPVGFALTQCSGTTSAGQTLTCNPVVGTQLTSQPFALPEGQTATFMVIGTLNSATTTDNKAKATYTHRIGTTVETSTDKVDQTPHQNPIIIDKQQKYSDSDTYQGVGVGTPSNLTYQGERNFDFFIVVENKFDREITNIVMRDTLPEGFTFASCVATHPDGTPITCTQPVGRELTSSAFTLKPGQKAIFVIKGKLEATVATKNEAWATYSPTPGATPKETPKDSVHQKPEAKAPVLSYTKLVRNATKNTQFDEANTQETAITADKKDNIVYEIHLFNEGGPVVHPIVFTDTLPTSASFVVSGYSINSGAMTPVVAGTTQISLENLRELLNASTATPKRVTIQIFGYVPEAAPDNAFNNIATFNHNGVEIPERPANDTDPAKTNYGRAAWVKLPEFKPNPDLEIVKRWGKGETTNPDSASIQRNLPVRFVLHITNNGNVAADAVVEDVCPQGMTCKTYGYDSHDTATTPWTTTIDAGTIPVGGSKTIYVLADINVDQTVNELKNTVDLYRKCDPNDPKTWTQHDKNKPGLCYENPSTITITFTRPPVSRCGDGILSRLEQCDMGNQNAANGAGRIGKWLSTFNPENLGGYDTNTVVSKLAGQYDGRTCSEYCTIVDEQGKPSPKMPACWNVDSIISVMTNEYLPIAWDVEINRNSDTIAQDQCNPSNAGKLRNDLKCTFTIYGPGQESRQQRAWTETFDCSKSDGQQYANKFKDPLYQDNYLGSYIIQGTEFQELLARANNSKGEYKLELSEVKYNYCDGQNWKEGAPYKRVCQIDFAVTEPYLMQKGVVTSQTNTNLSSYKLLNGGPLFPLNTQTDVNQITTSNYGTLTNRLKQLTEDLIAKYERTAVSASVGGVTAKKVPSQHIYILDGNQTIDGSSLPKFPLTLIVKGNVRIKGNVASNVLIISQGTMTFDLPGDPQKFDDSVCNPQEVQGIFVALGGFVAGKGNMNTDPTKTRCRKGNLHVKGSLIGNNLQDLVNSRRSHLEHWFTQDDNGRPVHLGSNGDQIVKAQRREEVYKGASVYIQPNSTLWNSKPPASDDFLRTLNISR